MLRLWSLAAVLVVAMTSAARAQEEPPQLERREEVFPTGDDDLRVVNEAASSSLSLMPTFQSTLRAGAGAINGETTSPGRGGLSVLEGTLVGGIEHGRFKLEVPLDASTHQTFGTSLSESHLYASARGIYQFDSRLRVVAEGGLAFVWRPHWPDPFQPVGSGMVGTNRYGHWDRLSGVEVMARPMSHERLRLRYDYTLQVYQRDPMFDAIYNPSHLAPWDQDTHRLDGIWRHSGRGWNLGLGAELGRRQYFFTFAGDAITGVNHAGPGGVEPNPLLRLRWAKPRAELEVQLAQGAVVLGAVYELELVQDLRDGYLSYVGQHPQLSLSWALPRAIRLSAHTELFLRRYGPNSYFRTDANDIDHPPLTWGTRRTDRLATLDLGVRVPVLPHWSAIANATIAVRRTNYAAYSVHWNYNNWAAWTGAEYTY